jgi:hypothetical protein
MRKYCALLLLPLLCQILLGSSVVESDDWESKVKMLLNQLMACDEPVDDISPCNRFVGEGLKIVYKVDDLYSEKKKRYLVSNEIANYLEASDNWTLLGTADDQDVLNEAQGYANVKKAIVAVQKGESSYGHVALIIPGSLTYSGTWGKNVPNSASFFIHLPNKSYVGKGLSWAWKVDEASNVKIYGRNFSNL